MEKRRGNLLRKVVERQAEERKKRVQLGKRAGGRIFDDMSSEGFDDQKLRERLHNAQAGHSKDYASAVWPGYVERAKEVFKQTQQSQN